METTLPPSHCAKVLIEWAEHFVKQSQRAYDVIEAELVEESIQLRIAKDVEAERDRYDPDRHLGFGVPTPEQRFMEELNRLKLSANEKFRALENNRRMLEYIKQKVSDDIS